MGAGNITLDGWNSPMADRAVHGEGLWRENLSDCAFGGILLVVVERIRVLHTLNPPPDIGQGDRFLELAATEWLAHPLVGFRSVERFEVNLVELLCHDRYSS